MFQTKFGEKNISNSTKINDRVRTHEILLLVGWIIYDTCSKNRAVLSDLTHKTPSLFLILAM